MAYYYCGGYATEEDYRNFFLLPIVDLLAADQQYPVQHAGKRVDIRQVYWIILLLNMFSTTSGGLALHPFVVLNMFSSSIIQ